MSHCAIEPQNTTKYRKVQGRKYYISATDQLLWVRNLRYTAGRRTIQQDSGEFRRMRSERLSEHDLPDLKRGIRVEETYPAEEKNVRR